MELTSNSEINEFRFICINNNNNSVKGVEQPEPEPEPTTGTLKVTKQIDCDDDTEGDCEDLLELVNENDYNIQVTGNNPDPSSPFPGSPPPTGTDVTLGPGDYQVTETNANSLFQHVNTFF